MYRGRPTVGQIGRRHTLVRTSADPLARTLGHWELMVGDERWYGPDSLGACLEAQRVIEPIAQEAMSTNEGEA